MKKIARITYFFITQFVLYFKILYYIYIISVILHTLYIVLNCVSITFLRYIVYFQINFIYKVPNNKKIKTTKIYTRKEDRRSESAGVVEGLYKLFRFY